MVVRDNPASKACQNLAEDLVLYYYGELSEVARRQCEAHLQDCASCCSELAEMRRLLPLTAKPDEPPQAFWDDYSREMRRKLQGIEERKTWWQSIAKLFGPFPAPALATAAVVLLALTVTLGKGLWRSSAPAPDDENFMEVLPMAEQLDFFSNMELLDNLDLLETLGGQGNGTA